MTLPKGTPAGVLIALTLLLGLLGTMNISLQASISQDAMVPPENMALAVSMTSLFSADLFQATLFGYWLDSFGNVGYSYIWTFTLVVACVGIGTLTAMLHRRRRAESGGVSTRNPQAPKPA